MANDGITTTATNITSGVVRAGSRAFFDFLIPRSFADWTLAVGAGLYIVEWLLKTPQTVNISFLVFLIIFFFLYSIFTSTESIKGKLLNLGLLIIFALFDLLLATQGNLFGASLTIFQSPIFNRSLWPVWAILGMLYARNQEKSKLSLFLIFFLIFMWAVLLFGVIKDTTAYQDLESQIALNIPNTPQKNILAEALGKGILLEDSDINKAIDTCFQKGRFLLIVAKAGLKNTNIVMNDACVKAELDQIKSQKTKTAIVQAIEKKESKDKITAEIYEEFSDYSENVKHTIIARIDNSGEPLSALLKFETGTTGTVKPNFYPFHYDYKLLSVDVTKENEKTKSTIDGIQDDVFIKLSTDIPRSEFTQGKKLVYSVKLDNIETSGEFTLLFMGAEQLEQLKSNYVDKDLKKIREPIRGTLSDEQYNKDQIAYYKNLFAFYKVPELIETIYPFGLIGYKENKLGAVSLDMIGKQPVLGAIEGKEYTLILDVSNINEKLTPGISRIESMSVELPLGFEKVDGECNLPKDETNVERTLKDNLFCTIKITDINTLFNGRNPKDIFPPVPITFTAKMVFDYTLEHQIEITTLKVEI